MLLIPEGDTVRVERVKGCGTPLSARSLTSISHASRPSGRTNHSRDGSTELCLPNPACSADAAILDTRTLTSATFLFPEDTRPDTSVPPLALSPDEQSFVWLAQEPEEGPRIGDQLAQQPLAYRCRSIRSGCVSTRNRHSLPNGSGITSRQRGPDGHDVLVERPEFVPLPYHGDLTLGKPDGYQSYTPRPGSERSAMPWSRSRPAI